MSSSPNDPAEHGPAGAPAAQEPAPPPSAERTLGGVHGVAHDVVHEVAHVVDAAEELVGQVVIAAERSLARRIGMRGLRWVLAGLRVAWITAIIAYFLFGAALLATRYYLLPHIDDWRGRIESTASAALHVPVTVGRIEADWQGLHPRLLLSDVVLKDTAGATALTLPQVDVVVSWTTLITLQARMVAITIEAPELEIRRLPDHRFSVAGILIDPQAAQSDSAFLDWLLAQHHVSVRDARVHFVDAGQAPADAAATPPQWDFTEVNFVMTRGLTGHRFALQLRPPAELAGHVDLRGEFAHAWTEPSTRMASWHGRIYAQFDYADLARLDGLTHLVPAPARLDQAQGALRTWVDFAELQATRVSADVALRNVTAQLRPDLQPLRVDSLQGRITQTLWSDAQSATREVALTGLQLEGPGGLHLPATDLRYRSTQSARPGAAPLEQTQFDASHIALDDWSRLATQVPLPPDWISLIAKTAARGVLEDVHAGWEDPGGGGVNYSVRTRFSGLGFTLDPAVLGPAAAAANSPTAAPAPTAATEEPAPAAPAPYAFENLAGSLELDRSSGLLRLDSTGAKLHLAPILGDHDLALATLATRMRWSRDADERLSVDVDAFTAGNDELEVSASGSYLAPGKGGADEAPHLDLSGRIGHAKVNAVGHFLPAQTPQATRNWLEGGLLDGTVTEGSFYLHGDPRHFPYADPKAGEFHAAVHVRDGVIDVAPPPPGLGEEEARTRRWPHLTGIEADVVFDRNRLTVSGRRAKAYGYDLSNITARVAQLDVPGQHLIIDGQGSGPLADLLRYVATSPVNRMTGGWLASADGTGPARLSLKLDIPMAHAIDSTVEGSVLFRGDTLTLRPDMAPFSALSGLLEFNQRGIRIQRATAGYLGGDVRITADTQPDGTIVVQGAGTATPQGARRQVGSGVLRRVLDRTRGVVHYSVALNAHHGDMGLTIDSDLVGLAADLPEPFRKAAAEARPLHIETVPVAGATPARDVLRATLGNQLTVELHRAATGDDSMRIERGMISLGARANVPDSGLLLFIDQPRLDADRWQKVLGPIALTSSAAPAVPVSAAGAAAAGDTIALDVVGVHAGELIVAGKSISNVSVSAHRDGDQGWLADIDSDQASGSLHWISSHPGNAGRLTARLAKLVIPEQDQKQVTELLDTPPSEIPALDIVADQFELGASKLGRLEVEAQNSAAATGAPRADAWNLQKLAITNPDGHLSATGVWQRDPGATARRMAMKINLSFSNAGGMLGRFGIANVLRNGSGKLDGELSWRGSPLAIDYASLGGKLHLTTEKGQFLKADAGAGRLLGVLSLQSLAHRVTGDFRDVFSEGFAYDSMTGSATIVDGTLTTDDFIMKGVNAVVRIKGSADLRAETQNLQVVVIPEINAASASLAYTLVNPAIGLGTFVANLLLRKPLSAAFTRVYDVTGPWAEPQVKRVPTESPPAASAPAP